MILTPSAAIVLRPADPERATFEMTSNAAAPVKQRSELLASSSSCKIERSALSPSLGSRTLHTATAPFGKLEMLTKIFAAEQTCLK